MNEPRERLRDAKRTRAEILDVATTAFAASGYTGTGVDDIAERAHKTKRMIYYYFGSKEKLYLAVLEKAYRGIREAEQAPDVEEMSPLDALRRVAEVTYDHHLEHSEFIRLVAIENIHHGSSIRHLEPLREVNRNALGLLDRLLERGRADGTVRTDVDALDVHMMISAYCFFQVANRYTIRFLFERDMLDPDRRDHYRGMIADAVVAWLSSGDD